VSKPTCFEAEPGSAWRVDVPARTDDDTPREVDAMGADTRVVPVVMSDGSQFQIEARNAGGYQDVGALDGVPFEAVTAVLVNLGKALNDAIERVAPKKASIEFGMEVAVEAGKLTALVCQGKTTANFTVKLEWER
jgi:hypothetical protein